MTSTFTLAHLSDIHLGPLPKLDWRQWNAKRMLGLLNWHKNRKQVHLRATLNQITADLAAQHVDHIAVTGDLANIGLPEEYRSALAWLARLGSPERVTVVPGNHDIYSRLHGDPGVARWHAYMRASDESNRARADSTATQPEFPFVRRFRKVALIGVNTAIETRPFYAGGRLGVAQRQNLARVLQSLGEEGAIRIVMLHHPPLPGQAKPGKALEDAAELQALLARHGAELVLHGHNHRSMVLEHSMTGGGAIPVVGVASASLGRQHKGEHLARYHLYQFRAAHPGATIEMVTRGLATPGGTIVELDRRHLGGNP